MQTRSHASRGLLIAACLLVGACSGGSKPPPGKPCVVNSDCTNPLSCSYGICHVTCTEARDCTAPQICVKAPVGNVCQLPNEAKCTYRNQCMPPLACALDRQCRSQCQVDIDCPTSTQKCVQPDGVCAEPGEINHTTGLLENSLGTPVPDAPPDAGAGDGAASDGDSAAGTGGSGGSGGGTGTPDGSAAGTGDAVNRCPNPQTSFGLIGQGDSNPTFQSGVGALGTNTMYIFSSSGGNKPTDGGAVNTQFEIYVQAFDPKTGVSKGPSQPLFEAQTFGIDIGSGVIDGHIPFEISSSAVAPTGEIALLYYLDIGPNSGALFAAFLSPSAPDGGADAGGIDGLTLQHIVLVTNNLYNNHPGQGGSNAPRVMWSNASQTFVVNHTSANPEVLSIDKYGVGGQTAGGLAVLPTFQADNSLNNNGSVGESGNLLGVEYTGSRDQPAAVGLTILDENENLVGTPIFLAPQHSASQGWASVAGTAGGFVTFYDGPTAVQEHFVSTSHDGGVIGAGGSVDGGPSTFPGFTLAAAAVDGRAVADDVGVGGKGGVGLALALDDGSVAFAYVNADGVGHQGPFRAFAQGGGPSAFSLTNLNGNFVISTYTPAMNSTQVVATGICP